MKVSSLVEYLDSIYPFALAEEWDNVGLIVGDSRAAVNGVLLALDVTHEVLDEAIEHGCNVVVTHHPPIFKPIKRLPVQELQGGLIEKAFKNDLTLVALHTNLDSAAGGLNDTLCELLGLTDVRPLAGSGRRRFYKLAVFVPAEAADKVTEAMFRQGAGEIGDYRECSFATEGTGSFRGLEGRTNPASGKSGERESVAERRIEVLLRREIAGRVVGAMIDAHPYEEVAYDLYPLHNKEERTGLARIGRLEKPEPLADFVKRVQALEMLVTRVLGDGDREISKVALCSGAGGDFTAAACSAGADVYLTAEIKHHQGLMAAHRGLAIVETDHASLEQRHWPKLKRDLEQRFAGLTTRVSERGSTLWRRP
jgi:dinuclear metal center YbgI/SA1388 family protein